MKHTIEQKVYYSDTDSFGIVWHGSYLRWLEMGRVELCEAMGLNMLELEQQDIVLPVTNMNIRYKASGKLNDIVVIETGIKKLRIQPGSPDFLCSIAALSFFLRFSFLLIYCYSLFL